MLGLGSTHIHLHDHQRANWKHASVKDAYLHQSKLVRFIVLMLACARAHVCTHAHTHKHTHE